MIETGDKGGAAEQDSLSWNLFARAACVRFGQTEILRGIDLQVGEGDCVTLIGPNGAGKTTLLLAMLGLTPLTSGQVLLNGADVARLSGRERGRMAAYVPQTMEHLPALSVYDLVAGGRFPHVAPLRAFTAEDDAIVADALARCGLSAIAHRPLDRVSGGERQKALIAGAIAQDARAMFLDEPTTALDPAYQIELVKLLREWHARGRVLIVVSHDLQLPAALGGRVVAMQDGRIVADGGANELLEAERLAAIYDAPMTVAEVSGQRIVFPRWDLGD